MYKAASRFYNSRASGGSGLSGGPHVSSQFRLHVWPRTGTVVAGSKGLRLKIRYTWLSMTGDIADKGWDIMGPAKVDVTVQPVTQSDGDTERFVMWVSAPADAGRGSCTLQIWGRDTAFDRDITYVT